MIGKCANELLLGIIQTDGTVLLAVSDAVNRPGHLEWVSLDRIEHASAGFVIFVKSGVVVSMFIRSRLNTTPSRALDDSMINALLGVFPTVSGSVRVYRD